MARRLHVFLVVCLVGHAFCLPANVVKRSTNLQENEIYSKDDDLGDLVGQPSERLVRQDGDSFDSTNDESKMSETTTKFSIPEPMEDSDEDDDDEAMQPAPTGGGGSNIFSLLRLAQALFPGSSGGNTQEKDTANQPVSPIRTLKMDILRALLQFGTSVLGIASSSSSAAITA